MHNFTAPICSFCGFPIGYGTCKSTPLPDDKFYCNEHAPPEARIQRLSLGTCLIAVMRYSKVVEAMMSIDRGVSLA